MFLKAKSIILKAFPTCGNCFSSITFELHFYKLTISYRKNNTDFQNYIMYYYKYLQDTLNGMDQFFV